MSAAPIGDLSKLAIHTITTKPWPIETAIKEFSKAGVKGITVWRQALENKNIPTIKKSIADAGLSVVSLCRGGFFPATDATKRQLSIDDNLKAIDEAEALGAPLIVLVCGAVPGQSLFESRKQIQEGIAKLLPRAAQAKVKLSIEPLHPMYADDRSAVNTLKQANDICEALSSPWVGVAADVYHLWWDPDLKSELLRCGKNGWLDAFHICDWRTPTIDFLNDRGLMGEGCINIKEIRGWAEAAGFKGFNEVEVFSNRHWARDQNDYLNDIIKAYRTHS